MRLEGEGKVSKEGSLYVCLIEGLVYEDSDLNRKGWFFILFF